MDNFGCRELTLIVGIFVGILAMCGVRVESKFEHLRLAVDAELGLISDSLVDISPLHSRNSISAYHVRRKSFHASRKSIPPHITHRFYGRKFIPRSKMHIDGRRILV